MKKILIALLVLCIAFIPVLVIAQPRYEADFSLTVSVNGAEVKTIKDYIYVYDTDVLDVGLNLKTNEDFYAGPLSAEIHYTDSFLEYNDFDWNEYSRFYSACKSYSNLSLYQEEISFLKLDMIPTTDDCVKAPNLLNECLINIQLVANGKRDDVAQVYLDESTIRNRSNPFGSTYFACYTDNGDLAGNRYDFGSEIYLDFSKASIKFKITDSGDVNSDKRITSSDSLLIMQMATGIKSLDSHQAIVADVDSNGKVNSSDGLAILQISAGIRTINDILNI
ncbi:MAG: dockerin type I repeat-containing protein [Clostridia bacterium]|nr:dockerin type I repeat-containing protein [Clostridia bacterium]